jgi:two-component system cell cycle sensor histidine kinase/response regulator CckA
MHQMPAERRTTILNVSADERYRRAISRMLRREGYLVREAGSGQEALRLAGEKPDLVVLAMSLPDQSGLEVCCRIKADPATSSIPVLHLCAGPPPRGKQAAKLERGAYAWLTQPVAPAVLLTTVKTLLRAWRAESEAREAARQWQATFDVVSHGVCLLDREGRIQQANPAMAALLGRPVEELIGRSHAEVLAGAVEPAEGWPFCRAQKSRAGEWGEVQLGERWLRITAHPVFDEEGYFAGAVRTLMDITERRHQQQEREQLLEQLEAERTRLEAVLRQMPAGVIIAEAPSGRVLLVNEQIESILRGAFRQESAIGGHIQYQTFHGDGRPYRLEEVPLVRSITTGEVVTDEEAELVRADGTRAVIRASSAPIRDRRGAIVAGVVTIHDITEHTDLEEQLRQSQKMEAMGRLAGGVAHDFNNLLTIIGGYTQMVLEGIKARDPLRRDVEAIREATDRAINLTRQLLTFSRRQPAQPRILDLNRLVLRMNRILRRTIGEDIQLSVEPQPDLGRVKADPSQLEQVIMNLAVNGRDAMPKGGKLVIQTANVQVGREAGRRPTLRAGSYVLLTVTDTGTGMNSETRSHLFEPFFTTKAKGKGTGLGLSTVYGIVRQSGGEIEVDTEVGRGTSFRIYLPVAEVLARSGRLPRRLSRLPKGTETILLVEDEAEVRRFTSELLTRQGYRVLEAASGPEALRLWKRHRSSIGMLVTDVIMPQMSGRELADQLKARRPDLKVLYISGYTNDIIAQHGILEPGTELLQKPFTQDSLGQKVRAVLDARGDTGH